VLEVIRKEDYSGVFPDADDEAIREKVGIGGSASGGEPSWSITLVRSWFRNAVIGVVFDLDAFDGNGGWLKIDFGEYQVEIGHRIP
jgi:hypothetical protein